MSSYFHSIDLLPIKDRSQTGYSRPAVSIPCENLAPDIFSFFENTMRALQQSPTDGLIATVDHRLKISLQMRPAQLLQQAFRLPKWGRCDTDKGDQIRTEHFFGLSSGTVPDVQNSESWADSATI